MAIEVKDLKSNIDQLAPVMDHLLEMWTKKHGDTGMDVMIEEKRKKILNDEITGILMFDNDQVVGTAWAENVGLYYGNMILHCVGEQYETRLAEEFIKSGIVDKQLSELIQLTDTPHYKRVLAEKGMERSDRSRMAIYLDTWEEKPNLPDNITFIPLTRDQIPMSSQISYEAHMISQDQRLSTDFSTQHHRALLEEKAMDNKMGKWVQSGSQIMLVDGVPAGATVYVEIECWGFPRVAWVFDVSLKPEYHGRGLGRILFQNSMDQIKKQGDFEVVGLSVTQNNGSANNLYESLGFFLVDEFVEFGFKPSL